MVSGYFHRIAVAAGPNYRYYKDQYAKTAIYGGKAYVNLLLFRTLPKLFLWRSIQEFSSMLENELLSLKTSFWKYPPYQGDRFYVNTVLAGAGLSQQIGRRSSLEFH